jgi:AraC-like DNA-binding protein
VAELIDHDFLKLNSVDALARACHLDASHLSRLTRRFGQDSPLRLLQRRKMQWAAERLENSAQLVRQVADELGMDAFQFSRTFKRIHGLSPSAFLAARA